MNTKVTIKEINEKVENLIIAEKRATVDDILKLIAKRTRTFRAGQTEESFDKYCALTSLGYELKGIYGITEDYGF